MSETIVQMRITAVRPPAGVQFCLQRGKDDLVAPVISKGADLHFDFEVRAYPAANGGVRLVGPFSQGPPTARFVYIRIGTAAGQPDSPWTRRVKVPLNGIDWTMIEASRDRGLAAAYEGTAKDGTPACATVKLTKPWRPA
jgi:hypothetical protein